MDHKASRVSPNHAQLRCLPGPRAFRPQAVLSVLSKQVKTWPAQGPPCLEKPGLTLGGLW